MRKPGCGILESAGLALGMGFMGEMASSLPGMGEGGIHRGLTPVPFLGEGDTRLE
jgi:hypothetical protein